MNIIADALRLAAGVWAEDVRLFDDAGRTPIADQFRLRVNEAQRLADTLPTNAKLIEAAPKLLDALKLMCDSPLVIDAPLGTVSDAARQRSHAAYKAARAVIAEATEE